MDPHYRSMVNFLKSLGIEEVPHSGEKGFLRTWSASLGIWRNGAALKTSAGRGCFIPSTARSCSGGGRCRWSGVTRFAG